MAFDTRSSLGLLAIAFGSCSTGPPAGTRPQPLDLLFEHVREGAYVFRMTNNLPGAVSCLGFGPVPEPDLEGAIPFPVVESWDPDRGWRLEGPLELICSIDPIRVEQFEVGPGESALVYQFRRFPDRERFRVGVEVEFAGQKLFVWSRPVSLDRPGPSEGPERQ